MMYFYGFEYTFQRDVDGPLDDRSIVFQRGEDERTVATSLRNLNKSSHNSLRITRILFFLKELGLWKTMDGFMAVLAKEIFVSRTLEKCAKSFVKFWLPVLGPESRSRFQGIYSSRAPSQEHFPLLRDKDRETPWEEVSRHGGQEEAT
jgi:hypothetical protein